jgi:GntR family transcriptional regulator, transcriptional repressor for pyruvate dehydrogenase complex
MAAAPIPFRAPARRRLHEDVADQLRDAILDGRFPLGTKLPPERELAIEFRVNRTSVREAIKVLEGLGLVTVRQGDGATVRPLVEASLEILGPMIFHGGRIDFALVGEMAEVMRPLLLEMGRLAIERCRAEDLVTIRRFRDVAADESLDREERYAAIHELFVLLADMARNRVWQILARRIRALFRQEALRATRERLRRDPGRFVPLIDDCLAALAAGRKTAAVKKLQKLIGLLGDFAEIRSEPAKFTAKGASR